MGCWARRDGILLADRLGGSAAACHPVASGAHPMLLDRYPEKVGSRTRLRAVIMSEIPGSASTRCILAAAKSASSRGCRAQLLPQDYRLTSRNVGCFLKPEATRRTPRLVA